MAKKYTKVAALTEAIRARKARGETNREIGESNGLSKRQVEQLINRQNRKERKIGSDMSSSLVTDTIREALKQQKVTGGLALHSDQGSQYTSQAYFDLTQE